MEDIARVWRLFVQVLHTCFSYIDYFSRTSSVAVGYALVVMAMLIKVYQHRRGFYGGLDVAADWEPTYGNVVFARVVDKILSLAFGLVILFGIAVLSHEYLPALFRDIFGFLLRLTA